MGISRVSLDKMCTRVVPNAYYVLGRKQLYAVAFGLLNDTFGKLCARHTLRETRVVVEALSDACLPTQAATLNHQQVTSSLDQLYALRNSALTGVTSIALSSPPVKNATTADWVRLAEAPNLWPVEGMVTGSFGERIDPFNGEGAFHSGIDISSTYGHPVIAPADGVITLAEEMGGYGRLIQITHAHGLSTRYGHLSAFAVIPGQRVQRGDVIGYVGQSGRSTGPHLHYEVRINNTPVNPYKYLRTTLAQSVVINAGS